MPTSELIAYEKGYLAEDTFNDIYSRYNNKIYNLAYRMTGNEEVAEDITQETFIKVLDNYSKFKGDSNIFTWIYSIAKNFCLQHLKKNRRGAFQSVEGLIEKANVRDNRDQYEDREKHFYINQVKTGCLLGLLRCLSFYQRMAFILNTLNDVSIKDVSKIIDKSENSVRILICRAKKSLRFFLCGNCSLYREGNRCKCENLISFSLKQGWIKAYHPAFTSEIIESELEAFKNEIALYKTIPDYDRSKRMKEKISDITGKNMPNIFSEKKVK